VNWLPSVRLTENLIPLRSVYDLEAAFREDDPDLWKAHSAVPLEEGDQMCDDCPYCLHECGDGLKEQK
jgi:hypothetical protein